MVVLYVFCVGEGGSVPGDLRFVRRVGAELRIARQRHRRVAGRAGNNDAVRHLGLATWSTFRLLRSLRRGVDLDQQRHAQRWPMATPGSTKSLG